MFDEEELIQSFTIMFMYWNIFDSNVPPIANYVLFLTHIYPNTPFTFSSSRLL